MEKHIMELLNLVAGLSELEELEVLTFSTLLSSNKLEDMPIDVLVALATIADIAGQRQSLLLMQVETIDKINQALD